MSIKLSPKLDTALMEYNNACMQAGYHYADRKSNCDMQHALAVEAASRSFAQELEDCKKKFLEKIQV